MEAVKFGQQHGSGLNAKDHSPGRTWIDADLFRVGTTKGAWWTGKNKPSESTSSGCPRCFPFLHGWRSGRATRSMSCPVNLAHGLRWFPLGSSLSPAPSGARSVRYGRVFCGYSFWGCFQETPNGTGRIVGVGSPHFVSKWGTPTKMGWVVLLVSLKTDASRWPAQQKSQGCPFGFPESHSEKGTLKNHQPLRHTSHLA